MVPYMIRMPGRTFDGPPPPILSAEEAISSQLRKDVEALAGRIGPRNYAAYAQLLDAAAYVEAGFREAGYSDVLRETYAVGGKTYANLSVEVRGRSTPSEIVIVGGHYDSVAGCPGANDNASGTAAVLALARLFRRPLPPARCASRHSRTRNRPTSKPTPWAAASAPNCRARSENVVAMLSLETIGFYSDAEGSQSYPPPFSLFYPSKGNFIAFVGNVGSRGLVRRAIRTFRERTPFPSRGRRAAWLCPRRRLVRPLVLLAGRLPSNHGDRYRAVPLSALPHDGRHP